MAIPFRFDEFFKAQSRRSPVLATSGIVASSHPLASMAGIEILQHGGNAADAAVACAAALNVTEPMSTGLGGDCFALFYDASGRRVHGLNGSGRAPAALDLDAVARAGIHGPSIPSSSPHAVTVPGAAAGWVDTVERFGRLSIDKVLAPAIRLATRGHPVAPLIAMAWASGASKLTRAPHGAALLPAGQAPEPGQLFTNPALARVMETIATGGKEAFYGGWIGKAIVEVLREKGGLVSLADLEAHASTPVDPISTGYRGVDVFEIPPNGQGITALIALNVLEGFDLAALDPAGPEYWHLLVESMRLAFADTRYHVADPAFVEVPVAGLLDKGYAASRRALIDPARATLTHAPGTPPAGRDTVYLATADDEGNACSFINSNYESFGTGIVPAGCGFVLQNRGSNFSLDPAHPNRLEPGKRPYHTIIPAMATRGGELHACFGVMGGFMQPQGHVQVLSRMIDHEHDPQAALDAPRFCIDGGTPGGTLLLEDGVPGETVTALERMGHVVKRVSGFARSVFGRGQVIARDPVSGVLWAGSDPRSDGCAIGY